MSDNMKRANFDQIQTGRTFEFNSTTWEKRSARTAHVWGMPHRWFYFSKNDECFVHEDYLKQKV